MSTPATTQELQNALDRTRGVIMGNMITRSDIQSVVTSMRSGILQDLHALHAENKSTIHNAVNHRDQIMQRIAGLEHSVGRVEQLLGHMVSQQSRNTDRIQSMKPDGAYLFQRI